MAIHTGCSDLFSCDPLDFADEGNLLSESQTGREQEVVAAVHEKPV